MLREGRNYGRPATGAATMSDRIADLRARLRRLEHELDAAIDEEQKRTERTVPAGFAGPVRDQHRGYRIGLLAYLWRASPVYLLVALATYLVIIPIALLDLLATLHQRVTFPICGIHLVRRADYVAIDRHKLGYLNAIEKLNCVYCGYSNGVIAYVREIASRTEQFWCPIKHAKLIRSPHRRYPDFLEYGDAQGYREKLEAYRREAGER